MRSYPECPECQFKRSNTTERLKSFPLIQCKCKLACFGFLDSSYAGSYQELNVCWDGVGASASYSYQLLICDSSEPYAGFFISGYTHCYKVCSYWCLDILSPYFRTAANVLLTGGVAFNTNGHFPNVPGKRLISVGLR